MTTPHVPPSTAGSSRLSVVPACVVCGNLGCEHCPAVRPEDLCQHLGCYGERCLACGARLYGDPALFRAVESVP